MNKGYRKKSASLHAVPSLLNAIRIFIDYQTYFNPSILTKSMNPPEL
jgi:hypothetical protein